MGVKIQQLLTNTFNYDSVQLQVKTRDLFLANNPYLSKLLQDGAKKHRKMRPVAIVNTQHSILHDGDGGVSLANSTGAD